MIKLLLSGVLTLTILSINNLLWINKGGEWYTDAEVWRKRKLFGLIKEKHWKGPVRDYTFWNKVKYAFEYRILEVWSNWRDITTALIFGGLIWLMV